MPPSSSSSSSSYQFWSDPHGLQQRNRHFPSSTAEAARTSSGSGVHSDGKIGFFGAAHGRNSEVHVRVARGLAGEEEGEGELSSTVLTTSKVSEAAASVAVDRPARGPSWRRSLNPQVSPWPIRHWWAQGWTNLTIFSADVAKFRDHSLLMFVN